MESYSELGLITANHMESSPACQ